MKYQDNTALLIGSFDPFHEGHLHLLKLAKNNFKKIIICVANNEHKQNQSNLLERKEQILSFLNKHNLSFEIITTDGMIVDLCKKLKINYLIRGYRNYTDFQYEKHLIKEYKKQWKSVKVKLYKSKKMKNLSSSLIRKEQNNY